MLRNAIERLLPDILQRTIRPSTPISAILDAMEELHHPSEDILRNISMIFNPRTTPARFVPYLARWVDLGWLFDPLEDERQAPLRLRSPFPLGLGRLRELIAAAIYLAHWRGTSKGLKLFLQTATGEAGFTIDEQTTDVGGKARPYHFRVDAPASTEPHRAILERIIEFEKPAYVTYELVFRPSNAAEGG
jgi:phage tail-like protein